MFSPIHLHLDCPVPFGAIWLDDKAEHFIVLDEVDRQWALQWLWKVRWDKHRNKIYAVRSRDTWENGRITKRSTIYLHKEICRRAHGDPPTKHATIADHKDGQSQNCRRRNLRWATPSENRRNINGWYALQEQMRFEGEKNVDESFV